MYELQNSHMKYFNNTNRTLHVFIPSNFLQDSSTFTISCVMFICLIFFTFCCLKLRVFKVDTTWIIIYMYTHKMYKKIFCLSWFYILKSQLEKTKCPNLHAKLPISWFFWNSKVNIVVRMSLWQANSFPDISIYPKFSSKKFLGPKVKIANVTHYLFDHFGAIWVSILESVRGHFGDKRAD